MRSRRLGLALIAPALLAFACSKPEPPPAPKKAAPPPPVAVAPVTCEPDRVFNASREFESMHYRITVLALSIQSRPQDPPEPYNESLDDNLQEIDEMQERAAAMELPGCLRASKELFLRYLQAARTALHYRRPTAAVARYEAADKEAQAALDQHREELAKQQSVSRATP